MKIVVQRRVLMLFFENKKMLVQHLSCVLIYFFIFEIKKICKECHVFLLSVKFPPTPTYVVFYLFVRQVEVSPILAGREV